MFSHFLLKTKEAALICSGRLPCSIGHFLIKAPGIIQHGGELTETATPVLSSQICLHCCSVSSCFSRSPPFDGFSCEHFYSSLQQTLYKFKETYLQTFLAYVIASEYKLYRIYHLQQSNSKLSKLSHDLQINVKLHYRRQR